MAGKPVKVLSTAVRAALLPVAAMLLACPGMAQQATGDTGTSAYPKWPGQAGPIAAIPYEPFSAAVTVGGSDFQNSVPTGAVTASVMPLSLDEAIRRGLAQNLAIQLYSGAEQVAAGQRQQALQLLLPNITASAETSVNQVNLAAEGFRATTFGSIPGAANLHIPSIVVFQATSGQLNLNWTLFSLPALEQYRNRKLLEQVAKLTTADSRETVVLSVAQAYLQCLADFAAVQNDQSLLKADQAQVTNTTAQHLAGVAPHLDELRARVQAQTQEQAVVLDERSFERDKIALERLTGIPAQQEISLSDSVPFAELDAMALPELEQTALSTRADYAGAQERVKSSEVRLKSARYERLPSLGVGGYYGVIGPTHGPYHGDFVAAASLQIPIFAEAKFRGDRDVAKATLETNQFRADDLKQSIRADIRTALLDLAAQKENVKLAASNVDLVKTELDQSAQRFAAGVQDNLPVVQSQATLANAQNQLVQSNFSYNLAKLRLARALGLVDRAWQSYLGNGK